MAKQEAGQTCVRPPHLAHETSPAGARSPGLFRRFLAAGGTFRRLRATAGRAAQAAARATGRAGLSLGGSLTFRNDAGRHHWQQLLRIVRLFIDRLGDRHRLRHGRIDDRRLLVRIGIRRVAAIMAVGRHISRHWLTLAGSLRSALLVRVLVLLATGALVVALALVALMLAVLAAIVARSALLALMALALISVGLVALTLVALTLVALGLISLALISWALISRARPLFVVVLAAGVGHARQALATGTAGIHRRGQTLAHVLDIDVGHRQLAAADPWPLAVVHRAEDAIIVIGMLQEVFCRHPVAGGAGVAGELKVFFQDLVGIAAHPRLMPPALVALPLVLAATAAHTVRFAGATPTRASILVILLHL